MSFSFVYFFTIWAICIGIIRCDWSPTVDLGYAKYRGHLDKPWGLDVYRGIRYAAPPIRWKEPQRPNQTSSDEVLEAMEQPPMCIQFGDEARKERGKRVSESEKEDCLFLNVYTPTRRSSEPLPVFVWIHGGEYRKGRADADPRIFMQTNDDKMVFVDIQYRLGILGFMSIGHYDIRLDHGGINNVGLLDQRMALQWVQEHIHSFGGDPARVTVGGHGTGATSAILQALAKDGQEENLFKNIIAASPFMPPVHGFSIHADEALGDLHLSTFNATAHRHNPNLPFYHKPLFGKEYSYGPYTLAQEAAHKIQRELSCWKRRDDRELDCLRKKPIDRLSAAAEKVTREFGHFGKLAFMPTSEGGGLIGYVPKIGKHLGFLRQFPSMQLKSGSVSGKNILIGSNVNDALPLTLDKDLRAGKTSFDDWFKDLFMHKHSYGLRFDDMEEKSIIELMYSPDRNGIHTKYDDGFFSMYDNKRSAAENSPLPLEKRPCHETAENREKRNEQQQMTNNIIGELFFHCPADWTAKAFAMNRVERKVWKYEYAHEPNIHGADLEAVFPDSNKFEPRREAYASMLGVTIALQRMWGNFIINDTPVITASQAKNEDDRAQIPVDQDEEGLLNWPAYTGTDPWMMVLDSTGGESVPEMFMDGDYRCWVRKGADIVNHFSLVNGDIWNGDRGARCDWWQGQAYKVPL